MASLAFQGALAYQLPGLARGIAPVTGTVTGTLPPGLTISSSGVLTGAATQSGEYRFAVNLKDAAGHSASMNWDVLVAPGPQSSANLAINPSFVTVGQGLTLSWSSLETTGCMASGGGANGSAWVGALPVAGNATQTATTAGTFTYNINCSSSSGSQPAQALATVTVKASSGTGGGGGGGGGSLDWVELAALAAAVSRRLRFAQPRRDASLKPS